MASKASIQNQKLLILSILLLSLALFLLTATTCRRSLQYQDQPPAHQYSTSTHKLPRWFNHIYKQHYKGTRKMRIGLINMALSKNYIQQFHGLADVVPVKFDRASHVIKWEQLFPEWIDESVTHQMPKCPDIPMPAWQEYHSLNVVVAKVPCGNGSRWRKDGIRDVFRLQVNLIVASIAAASRSANAGSSGAREEAEVYVVFVGRCEPMWEVFRCDDLLRHEVGKYWLYRPNLRKLEEKVLMPVGTCDLAPSMKNELDDGQSIILSSLDHHQREAYATVLHSSEEYVCGAIALAQSLLRTNTAKDLVLLADDTISHKSIQGLKAAGWKVKLIERIKSPYARQGAYNAWNYSKFRVWQLTEYDKVIFIDSDFIVLGNIDHFFNYPQLSAAPNHMWFFNSGIMVIEPSQCIFDRLMNKRYTLRSYNGGDQGYLNGVFTWWHRLTKRLNYLKVYDYNDGKGRNRTVPDDQYAIHFLGLKPWVCYKDYDCNWDKVGTQIFASDLAHERWWEVYKGMPKGLKGYCGLSNGMDERLRKWRDNARKDNLTDGHWRIVVKDPRRRHHLPVYL